MGYLAVQAPGKAIGGGFLSKIKNPVKKFDTGFFTWYYLTTLTINILKYIK
jgi:hypothetical protein